MATPATVATVAVISGSVESTPGKYFQNMRKSKSKISLVKLEGMALKIRSEMINKGVSSCEDEKEFNAIQGRKEGIAANAFDLPTLWTAPSTSRKAGTKIASLLPRSSSNTSKPLAGAPFICTSF